MLNQVVIVGRMAAQPEMRQTATGKMVTSFRVAVNRDRKNANGERECDFFTCVAWEKTAEFVCAHFPKGAQLALTGRLQSRDFLDKTGAKRQVVEIVANQVSFCGEKKQEKYFQPANENALNFAQGGNDDFAPVEDADDLPPF